MKMLYEKYNFTPDTNYQQIIDKLSLPYHLDGVIIDEFNNIILYLTTAFWLLT